MPDNFQLGDIVQLKSGGPKMTVVDDRGDTKWCSWFSGAKQDRAPFPIEALKRAEEDKKKE